MIDQEKLDLICKVLDDHKGLDIQVIDLKEMTVVADAFVICSGRSSTAVKGLADNLEYDMKTKYGINPIRVEGKSEGEWIVVDYGDIVVHVFYKETRRTYDLEQLWDDGQNIKKYEGIE